MNDYNGVYEGCNWTEKYLTVTFTVGQGAAKRFRYVKVPIADLCDATFLECINANESKRLRRMWEQGQAPLPGT